MRKRSSLQDALKDKAFDKPHYYPLYPGEATPSAYGAPNIHQGQLHSDPFSAASTPSPTTLQNIPIGSSGWQPHPSHQQFTASKVWKLKLGPDETPVSSDAPSLCNRAEEASVNPEEMLHSPLPCNSRKSALEGTDVFISYRRRTGSQLASLLKVHLQLHGFSVFLDVEKLEAGKFEDKLTQSVRSARNFVLVLSVQALDRCMGDDACKDWVHKEIATALTCRKNVIPVTDHFDWPDPEKLPEDMRAILKFNGIKWSHEYQEATIEKLIRFLQRPSSQDSSGGSNNSLDCGGALEHS